MAAADALPTAHCACRVPGQHGRDAVCGAGAAQLCPVAGLLCGPGAPFLQPRRNTSSLSAQPCTGMAIILQLAEDGINWHGEQVVALLYYMVSYFPGGTNGVMFILKMAAGAFAQCVNGARRAVFR